MKHWMQHCIHGKRRQAYDFLVKIVNFMLNWISITILFSFIIPISVCFRRAGTFGRPYFDHGLKFNGIGRSGPCSANVPECNRIATDTEQHNRYAGSGPWQCQKLLRNALYGSRGLSIERHFTHMSCRLMNSMAFISLLHYFFSSGNSCKYTWKRCAIHWHAVFKCIANVMQGKRYNRLKCSGIISTEALWYSWYKADTWCHSLNRSYVYNFIMQGRLLFLLNGFR